MKRIKSLKSWSVLAVGLALVFCVLPLSQAFGDVKVEIDTFELEQGTSQNPLLFRSTPGTSTNALTGQPTASIIGGTRVLEITTIATAGNIEKAFVDSSNVPNKKSWVISNDTNVTGWGRVVWSGSSNVAGCSLSLNWANLNYIEVDNATTDHTTNMYVKLVSNGGLNSSLATFQVLQSPPNPVVPVRTFLKSAFSGNVDFSNICRIELIVDPTPELDCAVIDISAQLTSPCVDCVTKTWSENQDYSDQKSSITLPDAQAFPKTLYAQLTVANGCDGTDTVVIEDTLPDGATKSGNTVVVAPSGFNLGEASVNGQTLTWTSTSNLVKNQPLIFRYPITFASSFPGQTKTNTFRARASNDVFTAKTCPASVSQGNNPPKVPSLNEWGSIILSLLLVVSAVWLLRKRRVS
jgi:hypothetical protein